jgi:glutathione S-transferase
MLTVYHAPQTRSGGILWLLEELGADYAIEFLDVQSETGAPESYRAIQPSKKVPAIVHDGAAIHERAAICIYLCDLHPQAALAPAVGDPGRGRYLTWLVYADAVMDPVIGAKFAGWQYDKRGVSFGAFDDMVAYLDRTLSASPYVAGDRFTAADILVTGGLGFAVNVTKLVPALPSITSYLQRATARPALLRARAKGQKPGAG